MNESSGGAGPHGGGGGPRGRGFNRGRGRGRGYWPRKNQSSREVRESGNSYYDDNGSREGSSGSFRGHEQTPYRRGHDQQRNYYDGESNYFVNNGLDSGRDRSSGAFRGHSQSHSSKRGQPKQRKYQDGAESNYLVDSGADVGQYGIASSFEGHGQFSSKRGHPKHRKYQDGAESNYLVDSGADVGQYEISGSFEGHGQFHSRRGQPKQRKYEGGAESNYFVDNESSRDGSSGSVRGHEYANNKRGQPKQRKARVGGGMKVQNARQTNGSGWEPEESLQPLDISGPHLSANNFQSSNGAIHWDERMADNQRNYNKIPKSRTRRKEHGDRGGLRSEEQDSNVRSRLTDLCLKGLSECMVCLDRVKQHHSTWDCRNCWQVI